MAEIFRLSMVRMYYSSREGTNTPTPFCEMRVYAFFKTEPSQIQITTWRKKLIKALNWLQVVFLEHSAGYEKEDNFTVEPIGVSGVEGRKDVKMVINGFEVESVDVDEVIRFFKQLKFQEIYRYVAFFKTNEDVYEYTETKTTLITRYGKQTEDGGIRKQEQLFKARKAKQLEDEYNDVFG